MGYNSVQKQVLEALLDQYERSKTYQGENKVIQSFQIPPEKVFPDYASDYADMDQIRDFEAWMRELGLAMSLSEIGATEDMIEDIVKGTIILKGGYRVLTKEEIREIVKMSM